MKKTNYFEGVTTLEELKVAYKKLALANHPDRGGSTEVMQEINNQYEKLFAKVKDIHVNKDGEQFTKTTTEAPEEFINIINELLKMDGVIIEIIGCFIWLSGNTKEHKEAIKGLGFKWSTSKMMWYKSPAGYRKYNDKKYTINDIRTMFDGKVYKEEEKPEKKPTKKLNQARPQIAWQF